MNNYKKHQKLLKDVMLAIQKKFPTCKIFERHVGLYKLLRGSGVVKINKPGMSDLWMLYKGRHIEIEIKTGLAKQTKDQKKWEQIVKELDCEYYVIKEIDDINKIPL